MGNSPVVVKQDGPVTIIQINRPEVRNAINKTTADELRAAWLAFNADDDSRVGILTGGDEVFSAGADLKQIAGLIGDVEGTHGPLGCTRLKVTKPTIAAIAGHAVAGGLELAIWCDLRIADETAVFGCFERRFGVPLVDGGTQRLPRIVGLGHALDIILTGRAVSAEEALHIGLINRLVPKGEHLSAALSLAKQLAEFPQAAMVNDRAAVYEGLGKSLQEGLRVEAELGMETIRTGETLEGAERFLRGETS